MKLENRRQRVTTLPEFFLRIIRYTLFASLFILISLGIGTGGYYSFAHLGLLDSFYMSSMILTGMGPTVNMTSASAKIFSSFYALYSGIAFLSITAIFLTPFVHRVLHILHVESEDEKGV
jgi:hypothetical protein